MYIIYNIYYLYVVCDMPCLIFDLNFVNRSSNYFKCYLSSVLMGKRQGVVK